MKEKTPKSPILVVATMLFLALFIALPPLFRAYIPKEEEYVEPEIVKSTLYCEKVAVSESKKISARISYENDVAVKNVMTFMEYTPTDEETTTEEDALGQTVESEINYLRTVNGVDVKENASQIVIEITQQTVIDNPSDTKLSNYLGKKSSTISYYEASGYTCSEIAS